MKRHTSAVVATSSSVAFTNTPASSTRRCSCGADRLRLLHRAGPRRSAARRSCRAPTRPSSTAGWASSRFVMPQILTRGHAPMVAEAYPAGPDGGRRLTDAGRFASSDGHGLLGVAAVVLDLDLVAGLVRGDRVRHGVLVARSACRRWPRSGRRRRRCRRRVSVPPPRRPASSAGLSGVTSTMSAPWSAARFRSSAICSVTPLHLHAEVGALDRLAGLQLGQQLLGGVDRDGEADAHRALPRRRSRSAS